MPRTTSLFRSARRASRAEVLPQAESWPGMMLTIRDLEPAELDWPVHLPVAPSRATIGVGPTNTCR